MPVFKTKPSVDLHWFLQLLVGNDDGSLFSSNDELACSFRTVLQGSGTNDYFFSFRVEISDLQGLHSILFQLSCIPEVGETVS